jgi:hypothetical protein
MMAGCPNGRSTPHHLQSQPHCVTCGRWGHHTSWRLSAHSPLHAVWTTARILYLDVQQDRTRVEHRLTDYGVFWRCTVSRKLSYSGWTGSSHCVHSAKTRRSPSTSYSKMIEPASSVELQNGHTPSVEFLVTMVEGGTWSV